MPKTVAHIPPALTAEEIEAKYESLFNEGLLAGGAPTRAMAFIQDIAGRLDPRVGATLLDNFRNFIVTNPSPESLAAALSDFAGFAIERGFSHVVERHEEESAVARFGDFTGQVNGGGKSRTVLFIANTAYFGILREALYLKRRGHRVFLASLNPPPADLAALFAEIFDAITDCAGSFRLMDRLLSAARADLLHVQCMQWHYGLGRLVIERKGRAKAVCEFYDISSMIAPRETLLRLWPAEAVDFDLAMERFIFQGADAVITCYPEQVHGEIRERWDRAPPMLSFTSYPCPEFYAALEQKPRRRNGAIRTVYAGNIPPCDENHPRQFFGHATLWEGCEALLRQGINVDIFTDPYIPFDRRRPGYEDFNRMLNEYPGFDILNGVRPDRLARRMAAYDFVLINIYPDDVEGWRNEVANRNDLATKFYSYLETGLPMISIDNVHRPQKLIKENGLGLVTPWREVGSIAGRIAEFDYRSAVENVGRYRDEWGMDRQIERLISFYDSLDSER